MNNLFCTICNKNYKSYQSLWNHKNKYHKSETITIGIYKCKYCNKEFDKRYNKYYHQKNCNIKINDTNKQNIITNISNTNISNTNISNTNISNTNNDNRNQTINIVVNNYNNDNLEYISEKFKNNLFNQLLLNNYSEPLSNLIENIKFNKNHKENNNVKITNIRSNIGFYYDKDKWIAINKNQLLNDLCDYSYKIFKKYFEEKKELLDKNIENHFNIFSAKIKSILKEGIKKKIANIAYIFTLNNKLD